MYDKMFEQAESFIKPMGEIMAINAEAFDTLREKQTSFVNELVNDSIEYAKGLTTPGMDLDTYVEKHQTYWDGLRTKITTNAQDSFDYLSDVQGKVSDLMQSSIDVTALTELPKPAKAPAKKKPQAKKAAPKAAASEPAAEETAAE